MSTTSAQRVEELVHAMADAARLAPSVHNTQPWRLRAVADGLAVVDDPSRGLPVLDPTGRLRLISCGAAVCNAEIALAAAGFQPSVTTLPDGEASARGGTVATVTIGGPHVPTDRDAALAEAIGRRRAHRRVHQRRPVDEQVLLDVASSGARLGARLTVADATARHRLAGLLTRAVREQASTAGLVDEVESWVRHWGAGERPEDGIPVESLGTAAYPVDSVLEEQLDAAAVHESDVEEALSWSTVVAITTRGDGPSDWVAAGRALERLWLHVTAAGLVLTFTDQATQCPSTRDELADVFDSTGPVQVVVRVGVPLVDVPATPRRPLEDVLS